MPRQIGFIIGGGRVVGLAGGPISIADMGTRTTRRLSSVEFNSTTNLWDVRIPPSGPVAYSSINYDDALNWEINHFNSKPELMCNEN